MVTFFRRIRNGFLESKQFRRYVIYATGEVLLVMVGILLALEVNNWNERSIAIKKEKNYIQNIYDDLVNDRSHIEANLQIISDHYTIGLKVIRGLEDLNKKNLSTKDSIDMATHLGWNLSQVIAVDRDENTWDRLKVLGNESYIIDDSITMELNRFYAQFDKQIERWNQLPKKLRQELRELTGYCHNSNGLEIMKNKGVGHYGETYLTRKCILSSDRPKELVGAIIVTSIVNTRLYEDLIDQSNLVLEYMDEHFPFLSKTAYN